MLVGNVQIGTDGATAGADANARSKEVVDGPPDAVGDGVPDRPLKGTAG